MKILIAGGDGFCGWPTALHLSARDHEICIVDNLSWRNIDNELQCSSLTPIQTMDVRRHAWKDVSGHAIGFERMDIATDYWRLCELLRTFRPQANRGAGATFAESKSGGERK